MIEMNNEEKEERRKYERLSFREDILIDGTKMCSSMDISEGGLYISTIQPYENNTVIDVTIPLKEEKLTVKAVICHCQPGVGMGVRFIDLNAHQRAKIEELINSLKGKYEQPHREEKNILLVEDNKTSRQAIKNALLKEGFNVIEANDGIHSGYTQSRGRRLLGRGSGAGFMFLPGGDGGRDPYKYQGSDRIPSYGLESRRQKNTKRRDNDPQQGGSSVI